MKFLNLLFSRMVITGVLIALQLLLLLYLIIDFSHVFIFAYGAFLVISVILILYILNKRGSASFKLPWIIIIMLVPFLGGILYLLTGRNKANKKMIQRVKRVADRSEKLWDPNKEVQAELLLDDKMMYNQAKYIFNNSDMPVYKNTKTKYLKVGEEMLEELLIEMEKAKEFIFLEYFIIQEGQMLDKVLEVLKRKVDEGVEVRMIYDDIGCIMILPNKYNEKLEAMGIKCEVFNPFVPVFSVMHNNRDHRKIAVIDGKVGFTGGINIADEYINVIDKHGHWKDTAIKIEGDAVKSLTLMFLEAWNYYRDEDKDFRKFIPKSENKKSEAIANGYVQPFGDNPLDKEMMGETIYMNIINQAVDYVYINTPYLIVDNELIFALISAAKRGVDVRITTPHVADKWYVHIVTQSAYLELIEAGVKIYEYTPGFIHAKSFVADDKVAVIGTINLDYRSLVHHFECGVWMYKCSAVQELKKDFLTVQKKCIKVDEAFCKNIPWYKKLVSGLIQIFTPLM